MVARTLIAILLLLETADLAIGSPASPIRTHPVTGRQYLLLHVSTWLQAEQWAMSLGGHLATVRDPQEQDWIFGTFSSYGGGSKLLWIGLNDRAREEKFVWAGGEAVGYTHWAEGEPNQAGSEDYVAMYYPGHSQQGRWNDWGDRQTDPIGIPFHGVAELVPGASGPLVSAGAVWRYHDAGQDLGVSWREPDHDDGGWTAGAAPLGYGDGDEATVVGYGEDPQNKHVTTYFRHRFTVAERDALRQVTLTLLRDDGVVVYLNGTEVFRDNLPLGGITHDTLALGTVSGAEESFIYHSTALEPALLLEGTNVLAVELHQAAPDSGDLSFDLQLLGARNLAPVVHLVAPCEGEYVGVPRSLWVQAVAEDDVAVSHLEIRRNGELMASTNGSVLNLLIEDFTGGPTEFVGKAIDSEGVAGASAPLILRYLPGLVPGGSTWRYRDDGADLGTAWRAPGYVDLGWRIGPAPLGYGDGDEATVVGYGEDPQNKHVTTYFRRRFTILDPAEFEGIILRLMRDDGAVVHLNGMEILRSNLPAGDILASTLALAGVGGAEESELFEFNIHPGLLQPGENVLAVEVHQSDPASSDLRFDLELLGLPLNQAPQLRIASPGTLSWSLSAATFGLESTESLQPPVTWSPANHDLVVSGGMIRVQVDWDEPRRFYRLREP